jgi:hypothetical protein
VLPAGPPHRAGAGRPVESGAIAGTRSQVRLI